MPTRKPAAVLASLLLFLACSSSVVRAAESLEVAPTWVAGGDHAPLTGLNAADQLVNWQLTAVLMSDGVSRSAGLGGSTPGGWKATTSWSRPTSGSTSLST